VEKFRGINPRLPVDDIAEAAFDIERRSPHDLLRLLAGAKDRQLKTA
jgi:hypothetical protein